MRLFQAIKEGNDEPSPGLFTNERRKLGIVVRKYSGLQMIVRKFEMFAHRNSAVFNVLSFALRSCLRRGNKQKYIQNITELLQFSAQFIAKNLSWRASSCVLLIPHGLDPRPLPRPRRLRPLRLLPRHLRLVLLLLQGDALETGIERQFGTRQKQEQCSNGLRRAICLKSLPPNNLTMSYK